MTSGLIPSSDLLPDDRLDLNRFLVVVVFHISKSSKVWSHSSPMARGFGFFEVFSSIFVIVPPDSWNRSIAIWIWSRVGFWFFLNPGLIRFSGKRRSGFLRSIILWSQAWAESVCTISPIARRIASKLFPGRVSGDRSSPDEILRNRYPSRPDRSKC